MGEVQYIVTLPQANQTSAIQLPSNEKQTIIRLLSFFIL